MRKKYYLPYNPTAKVNYLYLFALADLAEYNPTQKVYDTINYISIDQLAGLLSLSPSATTALLKNQNYQDYFTVDKKVKQIKLNCNVSVKGKPFVSFTDFEVQIMRLEKDILFCKYVAYLKYYCGYSKSKTQNFTGKQFLSACGYCDSSTSYLNKLSRYNSILLTNGIISIEKYREAGHTRNRYRYLIH